MGGISIKETVESLLNDKDYDCLYSFLVIDENRIAMFYNKWKDNEPVAVTFFTDIYTAQEEEFAVLDVRFVIEMSWEEAGIFVSRLTDSEAPYLCFGNDYYMVHDFENEIIYWEGKV